MRLLFERVATIRRAWQAVFGVEPPHPDRLEYWCKRYTDHEIDHALARAAKKLQKGDVRKSSEDIERYASGVLRNAANAARRERLREEFGTAARETVTPERKWGHVE